MRWNRDFFLATFFVLTCALLLSLAAPKNQQQAVPGKATPQATVPVTQQPTPTPESATPLPTAPTQPLPLPPIVQVHQAAFFVMIDPGHGGDDQGAVFREKLVEKDITLALARRLKAELQERGIPAHLVRDGDTTISLEQRAELANEQHASVYVALHAGMPGGGVRVYAPVVVSSEPASGKFVAWENAQANSLPRSRELAQKIAGELSKKNVVATSSATPLRPLNNVSAPAVAVELAPNPENLQEITSQKFQTTVAAAIAAGIAQLRPQWEGQQ